MERPVPRVVNGTYTIVEKLAEGGDNRIFKAVDAKGGKFIVRFERERRKSSLLQREERILNHLERERAVGFYRVRFCGRAGEYFAMVVDELGLDPFSIFQLMPNGPSQKRMRLKLILQLADQMLERIEVLHRYGYLHRDIHPDNWIAGVGSTKSVLYLIDFGTVIKYRSAGGSRYSPHYTPGHPSGSIGNQMHSSINTDKGLRAGRRDDLESIAYSLAQWQLKSMGKFLPWTPDTFSLKETFSIEAIAPGSPTAFQTFLNYSRSLEFHAKPDYEYCRKLFRDVYVSEGFVSSNLQAVPLWGDYETAYLSGNVTISSHLKGDAARGSHRALPAADHEASAMIVENLFAKLIVLVVAFCLFKRAQVVHKERGEASTRI